MSKALAAHMRLLESMPRERITTHTKEFTYTGTGTGKGYATRITRELIAEYQRLRSQGAKYKEIRSILHASTLTMQKLKDMA